MGKILDSISNAAFAAGVICDGIAIGKHIINADKTGREKAQSSIDEACFIIIGASCILVGMAINCATSNAELTAAKDKIKVLEHSVDTLKNDTHLWAGLATAINNISVTHMEEQEHAAYVADMQTLANAFQHTSIRFKGLPDYATMVERGNQWLEFAKNGGEVF